jgi:HSP20 family molecular chaperone IbpA
MSSDFAGLFDELARALENLAEFAAKSVEGTLPISANVRVRVGNLSDFARPQTPPREEEPLVDVIAGDDSYRVVVLLPGVKKEDVRVIPREGMLRVEVKSGPTVFVKEVPCDLPPTKITILSAKENNSVVELLFAKEAARK